MTKSSSRTDGVKFQVKLSMRTSHWILRYANDRGVPASDVLRDLIDERLYLFGIPYSHHIRLATAAAKDLVPFTEYLKDALVRYASKLPEGRPGLQVPTQGLDAEGKILPFPGPKGGKRR